MTAEVVAAPAAGEAGAAGVVVVTLRHDGRLNAMSRAMWRHLRSVFESVQRSIDVRCVLIEGAGQAFCAGGDISEYPDFRFDVAQLRDFHENDVWGGLSAMLACDVPIVARIAGACMGAGVEIASCCDIRIAETGARFGAPIAKLGFPMAPREAALVAGAVGDVTARQMLLEAATFDAAEMAPTGLSEPRRRGRPAGGPGRWRRAAHCRAGAGCGAHEQTDPARVSSTKNAYNARPPSANSY
jgi:enoyl-CoA hydratase